MVRSLFLETAGYSFQLNLNFFILANSVYRDEMPRYAAFHQGIHCLPKYYASTSRQYTKGLKLPVYFDFFV